MKIKADLLKESYFFGLILILFVAVVLLFAPFLSVVVAAFILVEFFMPVYRWFKEKLVTPWGASIITTMLAVLLVILPLAFVIVLAAAQAVDFGNKIGDFLVESGLVDATGTINFSQYKYIFDALGIDYIEELSLGDFLVQAGSLTGDAILNLVSSTVNNVTNILIKGFFMIFTMIYLFVDYDRIGKGFKTISPLPDDLEDVFAQKFRSTTRAVIKGTFIIASLQATAVAIPMWLMQVEPVVLWWVIMVVMSVIPIGSGVVWFPVGALLILAGRPLEGLFLIVYSAIIINVIDTTFRPRLIKRDTNLHPVIALFSILGGLNMFGLPGIIYGPLIAVFFLTIMEVYRKRYQAEEK